MLVLSLFSLSIKSIAFLQIKSRFFLYALVSFHNTDYFKKHFFKKIFTNYFSQSNGDNVRGNNECYKTKANVQSYDFFSL